VLSRNRPEEEHCSNVGETFLSMLPADSREVASQVLHPFRLRLQTRKLKHVKKFLGEAFEYCIRRIHSSFEFLLPYSYRPTYSFRESSLFQLS
jgi:hypothetical protein